MFAMLIICRLDLSRRRRPHQPPLAPKHSPRPRTPQARTTHPLHISRLHVLIQPRSARQVHHEACQERRVQQFLCSGKLTHSNVPASFHQVAHPILWQAQLPLLSLWEMDRQFDGEHGMVGTVHLHRRHPFYVKTPPASSQPSGYLALLRRPCCMECRMRSTRHNAAREEIPGRMKGT